MSNIILNTKLYAPPIRPSFIQRDRLLTKLNEGLGATDHGFAGKLTLVSAPAGFGKTTLIANWLQQLQAEQVNTAWLTLDENDNQPARFLRYFLAAMQTAWPDVGKELAALLDTSPEIENLSALAANLINEVTAVSDRLILVLDDYHAITENSIQELMTFWLTHMPPSMHIVMTSRMDPPFSLAKLRVRQQVTEIRADDLRFLDEETAVFLQTSTQLNLSEADTAALSAKTEGWIASLQLAALSLGQQKSAAPSQFIAQFTGSNRYLIDYLIDEILEQQPEPIRRFLLKTSILDQFNHSLCEYILQEDDTSTETSSPKDILSYLEQANLFLIPLDSEQTWFRYHHLFAEFLQHRLKQTMPEQISALHFRASTWFEQENWLDKAIHHAMQSDHMDHAARLLTAHAESLIVNGEVKTLLKLFKQLSTDMKNQHPKLTFYYAWAVMFTGRLAEAEALIPDILHQANQSDVHMTPYTTVLRAFLEARNGRFQQGIALSQQAIELLKTAPNTTTTDIMHGAAIINLADCFSFIGDLDKATSTYQEAVSVNQESGNVLAALGAARVLGEITAMNGQSVQAISIYKHGLQMAQQLTKELTGQQTRLVAASPLHWGLGTLYYQRNQLNLAEKHLHEAMELYEIGGSANLAEGIAAIAMLHLAIGQTDAFHERLQQLQSLADTYPDGYYRLRSEAGILELKLRFWQSSMQSEAAKLDFETYYAKLHPHRNQAVNLANEPILFSIVKAQIALSRFDEAAKALNALTAVSQQSKRWGTYMTQLVQLALLQHGRGETAVSLQTLNQALDLAEPDQQIRVFVDEGEAMRTLLLGVEKRPFITQLLNAFPQAEQSKAPPQNTLVDPLSERELEVLQLIATGATNQQIADTLIIAKSTAKKHVSNIIGKLGVENRTQAIAFAREINLI